MERREERACNGELGVSGRTSERGIEKWKREKEEEKDSGVHSGDQRERRKGDFLGEGWNNLLEEEEEDAEKRRVEESTHGDVFVSV